MCSRVSFMRRPTPTQNEITFGIDEMFFSTTNHQGVILDGNDVFIKISKYSSEELVGSPHSIIRHPDMPKIVFKALWDTILAGNPICAYVKNLAKDGSFYWVFATVIPIGEDFLSVRMKVTTNLKNIVENLYKDLIKIEKASGVDASAKALMGALNSLGFDDYNSFVLASISAELTNRFSLQENESKKNDNHLTNARKSLFKIFKIINKLPSHNKMITEKLAEIGAVSKNIEFSSLNTIIESERLGEEGRALAVIAEHISACASEAKKINASIRVLSQKMLNIFGKTQMSVALATLQVEMLSCLITQRENESFLNDERFVRNANMLTSQIEKSLTNALEAILLLKEDTERISHELKQTFEILITLDIIQKSGSIESARLADGSFFSQLFVTILGFIKESKVHYAQFSEILNRELKADFDTAINEFKIISLDKIKQHSLMV